MSAGKGKAAEADVKAEKKNTKLPRPIPRPSRVRGLVESLLQNVGHRWDRDDARRDAWYAGLEALADLDKKTAGRLRGFLEDPEFDAWRSLWADPATFDRVVDYLMGRIRDLAFERRNVDHLALTPARRERAVGLLRDPALLWRTVQAVKLQGVAREEEAAGSLYLTMIARSLGESIGATVKADSASGKNWLVNRVASLFAPENVVKVTRMTSNAPYYLREDALRGKILIVTEQKGADGAREPMRLIVSEGELVLQSPVKNPETGEFDTVERRVRGPVALISTTTEAELADDDETRNLSLFLDETEDQTRRIMMRQASYYNGFRPLDEAQLEVFQDADRLLSDGDSLRVAIPYAEFLAQRFPAQKRRARRDFPRLLKLIAASAFLHQNQRGRDWDGRIVADVADYFYATRLAGEFFRQTMEGLPPRTLEILEAAKQIGVRVETKDRKGIDGAEVDDERVVARDFTRADLAKSLGWSERETRKWVRPLEGTHFEVKQGGQGKQYVYSLAPEPEFDATLPTWDEVRYFDPDLRLRPTSSQGAVEAVSMEENASETPTSTTSTAGHICVFDPVADLPRCPVCRMTPPVEPVEVHGFDLVFMEKTNFDRRGGRTAVEVGRRAAMTRTEIPRRREIARRRIRNGHRRTWPEKTSTVERPSGLKHPPSATYAVCLQEVRR